MFTFLVASLRNRSRPGLGFALVIFGAFRHAATGDVFPDITGPPSDRPRPKGLRRLRWSSSSVSRSRRR
jgi:hypothetical protein